MAHARTFRPIAKRGTEGSSDRETDAFGRGGSGETRQLGAERVQPNLLSVLSWSGGASSQVRRKAVLSENGAGNMGFGSLLGPALVGSERAYRANFLRKLLSQGVCAIVTSEHGSDQGPKLRGTTESHLKLAHATELGPEAPEACRQLLQFVAAAWSRGEGVLLHHPGNESRNAFLAAQVAMAALGLGADEAIAWVADNRQGDPKNVAPSPLSEEQRAALRQLKTTVIDQLPSETRESLTLGCLRALGANQVDAPALKVLREMVIGVHPLSDTPELLEATQAALRNLNISARDPAAMAHAFWQVWRPLEGFQGSGNLTASHLRSLGLDAVIKEVSKAAGDDPPITASSAKAVDELALALITAEAPAESRWSVARALLDLLQYPKPFQVTARALHRAAELLNDSEVPLNGRLEAIQAALALGPAHDPGGLAAVALALLDHLGPGPAGAKVSKLLLERFVDLTVPIDGLTAEEAHLVRDAIVTVKDEMDVDPAKAWSATVAALRAVSTPFWSAPGADPISP